MSGLPLQSVMWLGLTLAALSPAGCAAPQPTTYEDCVLAHVKAGMSNEAVSTATEACRAKFPLPAAATDPNVHDRQILTAALTYAEALHRAGKLRGLASAMQKYSDVFGV